MTEYLRYAWIAAGCCLLTGGVLFLLTKRWFPDRRTRLGIALPAVLLSFAGALLVPPAIVVLRGDSLLPTWTAILVPIVLLLLLASFWRSVLNRLPQATEGTTDAQFEAPPTLFQKAPTQQADGNSAPEAAPSGNLLADIAREREALTELPSDTDFGSVVELLPTEHRETGGAAVSMNARIETASESQSQARTEPVPESQSQARTGPVPESQSQAVVPPSGETFIPLVPEPVPPGVPFLRLLDKAWEERAAARPVQAASWFLACLSRSTTPAPLRNEILMDLCALLKEHRYEREALELLSSDVTADCDPALRHRIIHELESALGQKPA